MSSREAAKEETQMLAIFSLDFRTPCPVGMEFFLFLFDEQPPEGRIPL